MFDLHGGERVAAALAATAWAQSPNDTTDTQDTPAEATPTSAEEATETDQPRENVLAQTLLDSTPYLADYPMAQTGLAVGMVLSVALVLHFIARHYVIRVISAVVRRSRTWWDEVLMERQVFHRLIPLVPLLVIYRGVQFVPHMPDALVVFVQRLAMALMVLAGIRAIDALLTAVNDIYSRYPIARGRPIKGYLQVAKIIAWIFAIILIIAALMDQSPWFFVSGLGAMMAVILLIFRDTLLSLVAGMQLVNNDLIRVGDWIEMPQFQADGDVVDISLNVVKVLNWDKTITVIPTHKFLEHSFRNWRSMTELGGRRIKRPIHVDMSTIRFLTKEEIERFGRFTLLADYIKAKSEELEEYNRNTVPADAADIVANARHLTNVGTFRAYITEYLRRNPKIHKEMTFLIRQLAPTAQGLPIEIYVFTNDTRWVAYEGIQADIFDHLLAVAPEFGLRVFQDPTGSDFATLGERIRSAISRPA